jgi:putative NADH-flavin reductase
LDLLCAAAYLDPGERTGTAPLGIDELIVDGEGNSRSSMEDYAVPTVDEMVSPQHRQQQFSVGY